MGHPLADGDVIDQKYRIVRFIGRGAWASVYEGVNVRIGRRVAIKVLSDEAVQKGGIVDRFEREAQAATRIDSEHVVHVFDLGVLEDGRPYIVMELLEGESLGQRLQVKGQLSQTRAVFYTVQALRGLGDAHAAGVTHRDIKPDNMVLVKNKHGEEILKIVDFGISKLQSGLQQVTNMTQTNTILGSPVYMSPEQCRGTRHMDHRSDLYSLGVVLFEMLTGQLPHKGETFNELMFKIALEDTESPQIYRPDLDDGLCAIVLKALARDPNARYQSAGEFEQALLVWGEQFGIDTASWSSRRSRLQVDDSEIVNLTPDLKRASVPNPLELAETRPPGNFPSSGGAIVRVDGEGRVESSAKIPISTKVSAQTVEAPKDTTMPETLKSSGSEEAQAATGMDAAVPPRDAPKKRGVMWAAAAGLAVVTAVVFFAVTRKGPDAPPVSGGLVATPASAEPSATASAVATTEPSNEPTDETPAASASAAASATASTEPASSEPSATTTKPTTPSFTPAATTHRRPTPPPTSTAQAAASATAAPAASASSKSIVDGRRIRTDF